MLRAPSAARLRGGDDGAEPGGRALAPWRWGAGLLLTLYIVQQKDNMTPTTRSTGRAPVGAYLCMLATVLVGAAAVGGIASLTRPDDSWRAFAVFPGCALSPMAMLGWFVFVSRYTVTVEPHAEDGVEHRW